MNCRLDKKKLLSKLEEKFHAGHKLTFYSGKWHVSVNPWSRPFSVRVVERNSYEDPYTYVYFINHNGHFVEVDEEGRII